MSLSGRFDCASLAFEGYRCKRLELERFCGQPRGRWTDQDLAGLRRTLQPRGDVHGVSPDRVVLTARGTDASGHNKAGIHPYVQAQRCVISIIEVTNCEEAVETRPQGMVGVVLGRLRGPEERHYLVTDEFVDHSAVALDDRYQRVEATVHQLADDLCVERLG